MTDDNNSVIQPEKISDIPQGVMMRIFSLMAIPLGAGALMMLSGIIFQEFNVAPLVGAVLILAVIGGLRVLSILGLIMTEGYVVLRGEVISVSSEKFDKKVKIVQMQNIDSGLSLSFRYTPSREIEIGSPVTLYMIANEPINNKDEIGPFVEGYLQVIFANVADDSSGDNSDGSISAADFLKHK